MAPMAEQEKPKKANRKADVRLLVMLTKEENKALEGIAKRQVLTKTLLVKWALYRLAQDEGSKFPWDKKYAIPSLRVQE
jgi:hypothetical protein